MINLNRLIPCENIPIPNIYKNLIPLFLKFPMDLFKSSRLFQTKNAPLGGS